jgi:hypothetical protein
MTRYRLMRILATAALSVGVSGAAVALTALPAHAASMACNPSVDAPWHSSFSNRVYFNSGVHCSGVQPAVILLSNEGTGRNGVIQTYTHKNCPYSYDCYSDGGSTYITYQGPGTYCGVIEGNATSYYASNVYQQVSFQAKKCVWL